MVYYFIGINGNGMKALYKLLKAKGETSYGCDYIKGENVNFEDIDKVILHKEYIYIIGNAFINHNLVKKIIASNYKYYYYNEFINLYFKDYLLISICGSHGKTQTTKLLATLLDDSISLIGDGSIKYKENARYFILESCEYKNTFLAYHPYLTLVLNVDYDHVDFFKTKEEYNKSFIKFINQSQNVILNKEDALINKKDAIYYSYNDYIYNDGRVIIDNNTYTLPLKGEKFANNFVGVYKVLNFLNANKDNLQEKLNKFEVASRRFQVKKIDNQIVILDYAHHYKEIKTTYEMIKENYPNKKIICIFEPHTLSRLSAFINEYKHVLNLFDETFLYKLFVSVREKEDINKSNRLYNLLNFSLYDISLNKYLKSKKDDVIVFLGAGEINKAYDSYIQIK